MSESVAAARRPEEIGILGGTGALGRATAARAAAAGVRVLLGSRDAEKAARVAADLGERLGTEAAARVRGVANAEAATAPLVVVSLPAAGAVGTVADLADALVGRTVVSAVVPLGFDGEGPHLRDVPVAGSVTQALAEVLPRSHVTAALHGVSAVTLADLDRAMPDHVPVVGDDPEALAETAALVEALGLRAVTVRGVRLAASVEALTPLLIAVNQQHGGHAGIALTGP